MSPTKYEYDEAEPDFHYENSGASHEEEQHDDDCNWIYGDCDCSLAADRQGMSLEWGI